MNCQNPYCKRKISFHDPIFSCPFCSEHTFCSLKCCRENWNDFHKIICPSKKGWNHSQNSLFNKDQEDSFNGKFLKSDQLESYVKNLNIRLENLVNPNDSKDSNSNSKEEIILGRGASSKVVLKIDQLTSFKYAIKKVDKKIFKENETYNENEDKIMREIKIHQSIKHPNIINFFTFFETQDSYLFILEFAEGNTLKNYILDRKRLSYDQSIYFFIQICNAVKFLHSNKIMHRDIKPENLLMCKNIIKLCDFGISTTLGNGLRNTFCGTTEFMAPEIIKNPINYDEKVDVWALGVLLFEMVEGKTPFSAWGQRKIFEKIQKRDFNLPAFIPTECFNFILQMLEPDPNLRLSVQQILDHEIVKKFFEYYNLESITPLKTRPSPMDLTVYNIHDIILEDLSLNDEQENDNDESFKRIAKLTKYNESSKAIHYMPQSKGSFSGLSPIKNSSFLEKREINKEKFNAFPRSYVHYDDFKESPNNLKKKEYVYSKFKDNNESREEDIKESNGNLIKINHFNHQEIKKSLFPGQIQAKPVNNYFEQITPFDLEGNQ